MFEQQSVSWLRLMQHGEAKGWFQPKIIDGKTFCDYIPSPPDERDYPLTAIMDPIKAPDFASQDQYVAFILDQGARGTCVSKTNNMVFCIYHEYKKKRPPGGFSTLYNYAMCKAEDGVPGDGTFPRISNKISHKFGTPEMAVLPYLFGPNGELPNIQDWMHPKAGEYKIKAYARLWNIGEIEQALAAGKQVRIGVLITDSFLDWKGVGLIGEPKGYMYGLHEMAATSYDRKNGMLRGPNSWGKKWGDSGFYNLSYEFCNWELSDIPGFKALTEAWAVEFEEVLKYDTVIELWIGNPMARVNGRTVQIDPYDNSVVPTIQSSRTMLPTRFIAETTGANSVDWDAKEKKVTLRYRA